jgi:hypothetical protein
VEFDSSASTEKKKSRACADSGGSHMHKHQRAGGACTRARQSWVVGQDTSFIPDSDNW